MASYILRRNRIIGLRQRKFSELFLTCCCLATSTFSGTNGFHSTLLPTIQSPRDFQHRTLIGHQVNVRGGAGNFWKKTDQDSNKMSVSLSSSSDMDNANKNTTRTSNGRSKMTSTTISTLGSISMDDLGSKPEYIFSRKILEVWSDGYQESMINCILPLSSDSHKGSSGRIGVLGGCAQYTGAPYYAAMSSLKTGSDLAFVFCAQEASIPIKCYSPELMVAPVYNAKDFDDCVKNDKTQTPKAEKLITDMVDLVVSMMEQLHCLVIGPGLGRCPMVLEATARIIQQARSRNLPLVIDADGLYLLTLDAYCDVLAGYDKVVLTPNAMEAKRLDGFEKYWQGAVVVQKGHTDIIRSIGGIPGAESDGQPESTILSCREEGGLKRSGGLGDILAGCIGTLVAWNNILQTQNIATPAHLPLACWTACCFTKRATNRAFDKHQRAMTAPDVLEELGATVNDMTIPA